MTTATTAAPAGPAASTTPATAADKVQNLRELAEHDLNTAQDAAWAWLARIGRGLPGASAEAELSEAFAAGAPADVDGQTEGILLGFLAPASDMSRLGRGILVIANFVVGRLGLMPWLGKKFDRGAQQGINAITTLGAVLSMILAPRYRHRRRNGHWEGFEMKNWVEESVVSPGTQVLVLDYENFGGNPWPINRIRDEAVEIVPGTYLGAKLLHQEGGYRQLAFWAARQPA